MFSVKIDTKKCTKCEEIKPVTCFPKSKVNSDGFNTQCGVCRKLYLKQYRIDHKDSIHEKSRVKYNNNRDVFRERHKKFRVDNKEKISEKGKIYYSSYSIYETYKNQLTVDESPILSDDGVSLEVKCKYCGKYFKPTNRQLLSRLQSIKGGGGEHSLYCSNDCKKSCGTYRQMKYPKGHSHGTSREVQPQLRKLVFERDNWLCKGKECCGEDFPLHCHHIDPVVNNPIESCDIDNCITLCLDCHKKTHKIPGCTIPELRCDV